MAIATLLRMGIAQPSEQLFWLPGPKLGLTATNSLPTAVRQSPPQERMLGAEYSMNSGIFQHMCKSLGSSPF